MKSQTPDKKQVIVLGVLLTVMLGVGAFQLMGGSPPPPKKAEVKKDAKGGAPGSALATTDPDAVDGKRDPKLADLAPVDPFMPPGGYTNPDGSKGATAPTIPNPTPDANKVATNTGASNHGPDPMNGKVNGLGLLPTVSPDDPHGPMKPGGEAALNAEPAIYCSGVVMGANPVAILTDETGNQSVVPIGAKFKGKARLISIDTRHVVVEYDHKRQKLQVAAAPDKPAVGDSQPARPPQVDENATH